MVLESLSDLAERQINSYQKAVETLSRLTDDHPVLNQWSLWSQQYLGSHPWYQHLQQSMTIAYARMALRNGSLSDNPRSYHNECHINDLLVRVSYCAEHCQGQISPERLAVLCYFAACHDLRQSEPRKPDEDESLVGANESASYLEAIRIIEMVGASELWNPLRLLLLKTMIEGSTFGSGGKRSKNFFQGNLAKHLLAKLKFKSNNDEQLVLLACDIDTANVSLPIGRFAASAIAVYDELVSHQETEISAHFFFCEEQKNYFFEQQAFHSDIALKLFQPNKDNNTNKLLALSEYIASLPKNLSVDQIKEYFRQKAQELEEQ